MHLAVDADSRQYTQNWNFKLIILTILQELNTSLMTCIQAQTYCFREWILGLFKYRSFFSQVLREQVFHRTRMVMRA